MQLDDLITLIQNTYGYIMFKQGSMAEGQAYPTAFFTYWQWAGQGISYYDNITVAHTHEYDINFYSIDPQLVTSTIHSLVTLLKANGCQILNYGRDRHSDVPSHSAKGITVTSIVYGGINSAVYSASID